MVALKPTVEKRIRGLKDVHIRIPKPVDVLLYRVKRTLKRWLHKQLNWRNYCGLPEWAQCNHKGSYKRKARRTQFEGRDITTEAEIGVMCFEGQRQELRNAHGFKKPEKARNEFPHRYSRRNTALPNMLILTHETHFRLLASQTIR